MNLENKYGSFNYTNSKTNKVGFYGKNDYLDKRLYLLKEPIVTICTSQNPFFLNPLDQSISKLEPQHQWSLMGFDTEDYEKAASVSNKRQLEKQAGNSMVVDMLESVFEELLTPKKEKNNGKNY